MNKAAFFLCVALLLALAACLSFGCNKGDDDDDNHTPDDDQGFTAAKITFTAEGPGAAGDIWLELASADPANNSFELKIVGNSTEGVYGVAGHLLFDSSFCELTAATVGDALAGQGADLLARSAANDEGGIFGFSRTGDYQNSVVLSPDKAIGTFAFTVTGPGTTDIEFNPDKSTSMNHELQKLVVNHWLGGTLTVE